MRSWLLIDAQGEKLSDVARLAAIEFSSGDGDEPERNDLIAAALSLIDERGEGRFATPPADPDYDLVLVPLGAARTVTVRPLRTVDIISWSGLL